jgi:hypothetical protein
MKSILSATAIALVLVGAVSTNNTKTAPKTNPVAMKSAAPVPTCPWGDPNGCGIMNF